MPGWEHGFTAYWWVCPLFMFIMILACFLMMRGCFRGSGHGRDRRTSTNSAEEILTRRYALGEIDRKEYEEIKGVIARDNGRSDV